MASKNEKLMPNLLLLADLIETNFKKTSSYMLKSDFTLIRDEYV